MDERILQIIPAPGWWAHYRMDDGGQPTEVLPLVCFALIQFKDPKLGQAIMPMICDPDGLSHDPTESSNFLCITGPGWRLSRDMKPIQVRPVAADVVSIHPENDNKMTDRLSSNQQDASKS